MFASLLARFRTMSAVNKRRFAALGCYAVLLGLALYVLLPAHTSNEQFLLGVVLLIFAILTAKTLTSQDEI